MNRQNPNSIRSNRPGTLPVARGGFTLVEMLVSVALVLLIMTLFAQAFSIAASSIKKQRGLAENDQRARSMVTLLLGDLQKRTFRQRTDTVTQPVNVPVDVDTSTPQGAATMFFKQLEDRANQLSMGLVPLHPDYFIGGAEDSLTVASAQPTGGTGAAPRVVDDVRERGYFYYAEGDPSNDGDDVLKFTIDMGNTALGNFVTNRLNGRAVSLLPTWNNQMDTNPFNDVEINTDQPIWDDGIGWVENPLTGLRRSFQPDENGTTASRLAEVALFIRDGKLYRRMNLIREPLANVADADIGDGQPNADPSGPPPVTPGAGPSIFDAVNPDYLADSWWNDFDHGVTRFDFNTSGDHLLHFSDVASLDNTVGGPTARGSVAPIPQPDRYWALGDPRNRFGHDSTIYSYGGLQGRPKEYMDPANPITFIGAYTHSETSHPLFQYPGQQYYSGPNRSPMQWGSLPSPGTTDVNNDGRNDLRDRFYQGPREGEDLLLANCHAFDVKVWDDALSAFVDIGHDVGTGDLSLRNVIDGGFAMTVDPDPMIVDDSGRFQGAQWGMAQYGGLDVSIAPNRVFDTWHPGFDFKRDRRTGNIALPDNDPPPNRPLWTDRDNYLADLLNGGSFPNGSPGTVRPPFWEPRSNYPLGARVFPRPNIPDVQGAGAIAMPPHMSYFYVAVEAVDTDEDTDIQSNATNQPNWPEAPGARIVDTGPGGDRIVWKAIPNTIGLKAIQITLRFFDPTSGQMRQLTLTHSFVEL